MRFTRAYRAERLRRFFQQHEVSQPRPSRSSERALAVCGPEVCRTAYCLFGSVVVIITERPDLRLKLDSGKEFAVDHNQEVSLFLRPVPSRQFNPLLAVNIGLANAGLKQQSLY